MPAATQTIRAACGDMPSLAEMLRRHPHVERLDVEPTIPGIEFESEGRLRRVTVGNSRAEVYGLIEVMDNNPIVCAEECSVPFPEGTLALVALGPAIRAGVISGRPELSFSFAVDRGSVDAALNSEGWDCGFSLNSQLAAEGRGLALRSRAPLSAGLDPAEVRGLYEEVYGRSFFVRHPASGRVGPYSAAGKTYAEYQVSVETLSGQPYLVADVAADARGKCGAAQLVHAMNLMAGFEESIGIGESIP